MTTATIPAQLVADLSSTLARLRQARTLDDAREANVCEMRLNGLIDKLPRST